MYDSPCLVLVASQFAQEYPRDSHSVSRLLAAVSARHGVDVCAAAMSGPGLLPQAQAQRAGRERSQAVKQTKGAGRGAWDASEARFEDNWDALGR